jgi:hypothetical protein
VKAVPSLTDEPRSDLAEGSISSFISIHEGCGYGFQVAPSRSGPGRLHLVCAGCGERAEYHSDDAGVLEEHGIDPSGAARVRRFVPGRESMERWLPGPAALPWWVPSAYILAMIAVGLGLIAFGLIHDRNSGHAILGEEHRPAPQPVQAGAAPATSLPPVAKEVRPAREPAGASHLHRLVVLDRFSLGVPEGWSGGTSGGAVVFLAPGGSAELRIFLQQGATPSHQLTHRARSYLAGEHPSAKISAANHVRLGKLKALHLTAHYPGGTEGADLLSTGGYSYLILSRVDGDASRSVRTDSGAIVRSFRPL